MSASSAAHGGFLSRLRRNYRRSRWVYWMAVPVMLYYVVFHYLPMFGVVIAFQNYKPAKGFLRSDWVGLQNFRSFFASPFAWRIIRNTLFLNGLQLAFGFPAPILLSLLLNEVRCVSFKRTVQTVSYMPHFISTVVICGMISEWSSTTGILNDMRAFLGFGRASILSEAGMFRTLFVASGIWQTIGWSSIIYIATLTGADPSLYEAATIDGAGRFQQAIHVSIPTLVPLILMQLILRIGSMMSLGYEKVILLYTPLTYETADVISSFIYRRGLQESNYSLGSAVGLFNSLVNLTLLVSANAFSRKLTQESLW